MLTNLIIALCFIVVYFGLYCLIDLLDFKYRGNNIHSNNNGNYVVALLVKNIESDTEDITEALKKACIDDLTICDKIFIIEMEPEGASTDILKKTLSLDEKVEVLSWDEKDKIFNTISR